MAADDGPFGVAKIGQFEYSVGVGHSLEARPSVGRNNTAACSNGWPSRLTVPMTGARLGRSSWMHPLVMTAIRQGAIKFWQFSRMFEL